jgi:hypothetical protein
MSMSPWKGWSANGRPPGEASLQRERSGGAAESPHLGPIQALGYGSPVAWRGWSALHQEPVAEASTAWTGWGSGREIAAVPAQPNPAHEHQWRGRSRGV